MCLKLDTRSATGSRSRLFEHLLFATRALNRVIEQNRTALFAPLPPTSQVPAPSSSPLELRTTIHDRLPARLSVSSVRSGACHSPLKQAPVCCGIRLVRHPRQHADQSVGFG